MRIPTVPSHLFKWGTRHHSQTIKVEAKNAAQTSKSNAQTGQKARQPGERLETEYILLPKIPSESLPKRMKINSPALLTQEQWDQFLTPKHKPLSQLASDECERLRRHYDCLIFRTKVKR